MKSSAWQVWLAPDERKLLFYCLVLIPPTQGTLEIGDKKIKNYSPNNSIHQGIALSPEDRKAAGIIDDLTVRENIILALQAGQGWFKHLNIQEANRDR